MKKRISVVTDRPLPDDSQVVQPDRPNPMLERVRETAVMVQTHTERLSRECRDECAQLRQDVSSTVSVLVRRLTREIQIPIPKQEL